MTQFVRIIKVTFGVSRVDCNESGEKWWKVSQWNFHWNLTKVSVKSASCGFKFEINLSPWTAISGDWFAADSRCAESTHCRSWQSKSAKLAMIYMRHFALNFSIHSANIHPLFSIIFSIAFGIALCVILWSIQYTGYCIISWGEWLLKYDCLHAAQIVCQIL